MGKVLIDMMLLPSNGPCYMIKTKCKSLALLLLVQTLFGITTYSQEEPERSQRYEATRVTRNSINAEQRKRSAYWAAFAVDLYAPSKENVQIYLDAPFASGRPGDTPGFSKSAYMQDLACNSDAVIVTDIASHSSQLAENTDYAFTDYKLDIVDVLKTGSKPQLRRGGTVIMTEVGGSVLVDGRSVFVDISRNYPLVRGTQYILFLDYYKSMNAFRLSSFRGIFQLAGSKVKASYYSSTNDVGELQDVSKLIRSLSKNCPSPKNPVIKQTR